MSPLEGKGYKEQLDQLFRATSLREEDFDHKAIALLDALHQKGKAWDACQMLEQTIRGRERDRVSNWRAYVYTLLRGFDDTTYKQMKRSGLKSEAGDGRKPRGDTHKKNSFPVSNFTFRSEAPAFVPGAGSWGKAVDACTKPQEIPKHDLLTKVLVSDDGRGNATMALKAFAKGEELFREPPLALVYSADDAPWFKEMRADLEKEDSACAWQYCVAVHCLSEDELPSPAIDRLRPMSKDARLRLEELCGAPDSMEFEPSSLALTTCRHVLGDAGDSALCLDLAKRLDVLAARVSRNGFQIMDLTRRPPTSADGLFHRISFCNHCCLGMNNVSWTWDGNKGVLIVKASRDIVEGEELTISYIAKPWCELAKPARQRYLQQNFNFSCLCTACGLSAEEEETIRAQLGPPKEEVKAGNGKLGNLLTRWLEHGKETAESDCLPEVSRDEAPSAKDTKRSAPLTDQDRLSRVLARCEKDGLVVSHEQCQAALRAEDGHVGKTVIRLKRQQKESALASPDVADSSVTKSNPGTMKFVPYACVALAAVASISLVAVLRVRQRSGR